MGNIDLFHSRRVNYSKCAYWVRDERDISGTAQEWVYMKQPSGHFYARPVSVKSSQMNAINGVWALDDSHITLETTDDIDDISRGSLVKYAGELWLVESVQRHLHLKESEFSRKQHYTYTIALARN